MAIVSQKITQEAKRQILISRLLEKGITETQDEKSIYDLDYYSLRHELVMADFRGKME
ncbi:hypothetical protein [Bacillus methanolicus]|uniref:hypothetical protein n=1 Tax=Bacillus methanolicus TaxID=1471 RepID=UPI00200D3C15|nr:hypothetical protein [Bacillus methanolicus]